MKALSDVPSEFVETVKEKVRAINWVLIISVLGIIGFIILAVWVYFHYRGKKETSK